MAPILLWLLSTAWRIIERPTWTKRNSRAAEPSSQARNASMKRRTFFKRLFGGLGAAAAGAAIAVETRSVLIQESPIAGFQFHQGNAIWPSLSVGAGLKLVREPQNIHDADAVAVYFQNEMLGYVPRGENSAIAQMLDRGESLAASVSRLQVADDPWERIRFNVFLA